MYVSMKDILTHADKHNYAVMAVNSVNMEMARAVITAVKKNIHQLLLILVLVRWLTWHIQLKWFL